jgi:hypothetical protein
MNNLELFAQEWDGLVTGANSLLARMRVKPMDMEEQDTVEEQLLMDVAHNGRRVTPITVVNKYFHLFPPDFIKGGRLHMTLSHRGKV